MSKYKCYGTWREELQSKIRKLLFEINQRACDILPSTRPNYHKVYRITLDIMDRCSTLDDVI